MPPSPDEPTPWEIVRRITGIEGDVKDLERRQAEHARDAEERLSKAKDASEAKYVRRETWSEARKFDQAVAADTAKDVQELKDARTFDVGWRRQVMLALGIAFIGLLGVGVTLVVNIVSR